MFLFGNRLKYPRGYALGDLWVQVPFSIKVEFTGSLKRGVMVRDVAQKVIGDLGKDRAILSAAEFTGPSIAEFSVDDRMTLCSRIISKGFKSSRSIHRVLLEIL